MRMTIKRKDIYYKWEKCTKSFKGGILCCLFGMYTKYIIYDYFALLNVQHVR